MNTNKAGRRVVTVYADGRRGSFQLCHTPENAIIVAEKLRRKIASAKSKPQKPGSTLAQYAAIVSVEIE